MSRSNATALPDRVLRLGAWVLLAAGSAFRLYWAFASRESFGRDGNRHGTLLALARNLQERGFYSADGMFANVSEEPLFPFLIALADALPGPHWLGFTVVQLVITAIGARCVHRFCTACALPRSQALLATALFVAHPYLASQAVVIADTQLFASVLAANAAAWAVLLERNRRSAAIAAGLCLALGFATRGTALLLLPTLAVFFGLPLWMEGWTSARRRLPQLALAASVTLAALSPWLLRNWLLTDQLFIATHGRAEFAIGNNSVLRQALELGVSLDSIDIDPGGHIATAARRRAPVGSPHYELTYANLARQKGIDWIGEHPTEFLGLIPLRLHSTWSWNLTPIFATEGTFRPNYDRRATVLRLYLVPVTLLALLGFLHPGLWSRGTLFCSALLLAFSCAVAVLYGYTRLRAPFDTFLVVPAVQAAGWILATGHRAVLGARTEAD